jgi:L-alanine-DL-glutamate epimerase-like enolase superfamily enzyme
MLNFNRLRTNTAEPPRGGSVWANNKPGFGVNIDEEHAAKYPIDTHVIE